MADSRGSDFARNERNRRGGGLSVGILLQKEDGLRWGWGGLSYPVYNNYITKEWKLGKLVLTLNPDKAFAFLRFDFERTKDGFNTPMDMFEYVARSTYFSVQPFLFENMNARQWKRDAQRPTYHEFLRYLEGLPLFPKLEHPSPIETLRHAEVFFQEPFFAKVLECLMVDQRIQAAAKKFNANIIKERFGLEGKTLGEFMRRWKDQFSSREERVAYVLETPLENLLKQARKLLENTG